MTSSLTDLLGTHLQRTHTSVNRLAILSGVPQRTIANWLNGFVRKPHQWQPLLKVALALHLTEPETDELLRSTGHASLAELRAATRQPDDLALLDRFPRAVPTSPPPFQAIADLPTFVGRLEELQELKHALLDGGRATVYGLRGMGGVGKTTLAAHLAYQVRDQFPDGVLWARLDTSDSLSILGAFADAYGKDVSSYKDVESRASVVRNLLAEKRALLVLDNAETSAQVRALLPPSTGRSAVLITTRHDLSVSDGWRRVTLEPFDTASDEALLLFGRYLGEEFVRAQRDLLVEIAALLGHLPLALAIAAGRLANEVHVRRPQAVNSLLDSLRTTSSRLDLLRRDDLAVRASFELSYVALQPSQQELFCTLGVFSGEDFGADAVAFLTEVTPAQANEGLKNLYSLSLVQVSRAGRWRLHPLLLDYARENLEASGRLIPVVERALLMYRQAVQGEWVFERSLDEEIPNIRFALDQAGLLKLYRPLVDTVRAMYLPLSLGAWLELASRALTQARLAAEALGDLEAEIYCLESLGSMQQELGDNTQARENFQRALQLAQSAGRKKDMAKIFLGMGKLEIDIGYQKQARTYFEEGLALARESGDELMAGKLTNNLALTLMRESKYAEAEALYLESLVIARSFQDLSAMTTALTNLGTVASLQDELEKAESYWREGLALARTANIRISIIMLLANLALIHAERLEYQAANQSFEEGLELARDVGSPRMESAVRSLFGDILRKQGRLEAAVQQLVQANTLADEAGDVERRGVNLGFLGELYLEQNQLEEAGAALAESMTIMKQLEQDIRIADTFLLQAKVAYARDERDECRRLIDQALQIYQRLGDAHRLDILQKWLDSTDM